MGGEAAKTKTAGRSARAPLSARAAREAAEAGLAELQSRIQPLENEINQLTRQFWVTKQQVAAQGYDLSASRYREVEHEETFYEEPDVTLERMHELEQCAKAIIQSLQKL
jgi:type I restriction enzyme M protein